MKAWILRGAGDLPSISANVVTNQVDIKVLVSRNHRNVAKLSKLKLPEDHPQF